MAHTAVATLEAEGISHPAIVPRWEWRMFTNANWASRVSPFMTTPMSGARIETYLLSSVSPHTVKIRDDRLNIKRVEQRRRDGLELWQSVLTTAFPVDAATIPKACDAWGIPAPLIVSRLSSMASLLAYIVAPARCLRVVTVVKRCARLSVLECQGEFVELVVEGARWESIAFADPSPDRVSQSVAHLGWDAQSNTSYPEGLKSIVGFRALALS